MKPMVRVEPHEAVKVWGIIVPFVHKLLNVSNGEYSERDVLDHVLDGKFDLWLAWSENRIDGFAIAYPITFPQCRRYMVVGAGGTDAKCYMLSAIAEMTQRAIELGCTSPIKIVGRKGWAKFLPDYKVEQWIFEVPF